MLYAGLLPAGQDPAERVTLDPGLTPLVSAPALAAAVGLRAPLWVKDDSANPTHSFKDRVVSVASAKAVELGLTALACPSTGNLAGAVAAQAAALGLDAQPDYPITYSELLEADARRLMGPDEERSDGRCRYAPEWLILCTGLIAMFLGFTKRRLEAVSELHQGTSTRPVLEHYSLPFLDQMVSLVTTGTVISYAIYTVNSPQIGSQMMLTIPPVVYGIFRYLYLIYDRNDDRSMSGIIAGDRGIQAAGAAFAVTAFLLLYVF